jgi:hypothetical protein
VILMDPDQNSTTDYSAQVPVFLDAERIAISPIYARER